LWQGEAGDSVVWQAHGDEDQLLLIVTRTAPTTMRHQPHLRLDMVDPARRYRLTRDGTAAVDMDGAWLARMGLPLPPMKGEEVLVYELTAR